MSYSVPREESDFSLAEAFGLASRRQEKSTDATKAFFPRHIGLSVSCVPWLQRSCIASLGHKNRVHCRLIVMGTKTGVKPYVLPLFYPNSINVTSQ